MTLSLDEVTLGVPDVRAAHTFYTSVFAPVVTDYDQYVNLGMHGAGQVGLIGAEAQSAEAGVDTPASGFGGSVLSFIVDQPGEVEALLCAAADAGATVLKPAKKEMFAGFSAVFQAPDGAIWKLASATKKDTAPAAEPPVPSEVGLLLGVADPKASKAFYEAVGMTVDRDYGSKYVDFSAAPGACRLALMERRALGKDAGVDGSGDDVGAAVLHRRAASPDEVDSLLSAATSAGGRVTAPAEKTDWGGYSAHVADPDGFVWKVACARA